MRSAAPVLQSSAICIALALAPVASHAQNQLAVRTDRPTDMAGLYRVELPAVVAPDKIRFLRLMPDGRARWETLEIDASTSVVKANVKVDKFSDSRWHLKSIGEGRSPHFCYPDATRESCYAFHAEYPRQDLLLFATDANWAQPTIILRRERASSAHDVSAQSSVIQPGCFRVTHGPWSTQSRLGPDKPTVVFRLDTVMRYPRSAEYLVAERIEPSEFAKPGDPRLSWKRNASWRRKGADSVEIVTWSTATEAEVFYGRWTGNSFKGVMRLTSDAIPVDAKRQILWNVWPWAAATAVRVPCP